MNELNRCGGGHKCEQDRLDFLFRLAGRKLVKRKAKDKINDKIPGLPPIFPPPPGPNPPDPVPPPSPPPRLPQCLGSPCGGIVDGQIRLGRCGIGIGGAEVVCSRFGYQPFPEGANTLGCGTFSDSYCHCCDVSQPTPVPPPPPVPPPQPPVPPPPSPVPPNPPPIFPPPPGPYQRCGAILGNACVTFVTDNQGEQQTLFGTCFANDYPDTDPNAEIATCAAVGGVPALASLGCGRGRDCVCCIDAASLCEGAPEGTCSGGHCSCILTYNGASCNNPVYAPPDYPGYQPPPSNGGGCQENLCNALSSQNGYPGGAACCPFC